MPRSRDRHGRGIRGPLAAPNPLSGRPVPLQRPSRVDFFNSCVTEAMALIGVAAPDALTGVVVGVEEVPNLNVAWSGERVPLSAALEPTRGRRAQIVIFERPLELRATSRGELRRLVHQTIVEQLSALTGRSIAELGGEEGWDD
ncbi:metallopeptidase family protein [Tessaracoccus defluvii]|uniref:Metallopeptidase family protein n=1 Tax=Tessaracoccus defluvii TaxID=1285901 RepID=A0A7H0H9Q2_9ACTN|nr:metallopeptidase family protein [Tessaracoccus defluvii]